MPEAKVMSETVDGPYPYQGDVSRTATMAELANPLSVRLLDEVGGLEPGSVIVDVGAGTGTALGDEVIDKGARYLPIDVRTSAVEAHQAAGHREARLGDATALPLPDKAMAGHDGVLHSRFTHAWLGEGRKRAWDEAGRIGLAQGVVIDYDYTPVNNVANEQYREVVESVQGVLGHQGFEPDYGSRLPDDSRRALNDLFGAGRYSLTVTRASLSADTLDQRMAIVSETVDSVATALDDAGMESVARSLRQKLQALRQLQSMSLLRAADVPLPDMVGVAFKANEQPVGDGDELDRKRAAAASRLPTLGGEFAAEDAVQARQFLASEGHPDREAARKLFTRMYRAAGYFDRSLSPDELLDATDPAELDARSDTFTITEGDKLTLTIRLVSPNGDGVWSLPTAKKLTTESRNGLPDEVQRAVVGEAGYFASISHSPLAPLKVCMALVNEARTRGMDYVLIGTVEGHTTERIATLFGPAIEWPQINDQPVKALVNGPGYREDGITLRVGYVETDTFFEQLGDHYRNADAAHQAGLDQEQARYMVRLCDELQPHQTQLEAISA